MSRILRRPMFRGGKVDSRGTGITTGLDQPRIGAKRGRFFGDTGNIFTAGLALQPRGSFTPRVSARGRTINPPLYEEFPQISSDMPAANIIATADEGFIPQSLKDKSTADVEIGLEETNLNPDEFKVKETEKVDIKDDEPEVTMTDLEKALGLDRARQEYAADALAAASKAFFEGKGFGAIADAAAVKSKAPDIKRLAAIEEFKMKGAKDIAKLRAKNKTYAPGNAQKNYEFFLSQGVDKDQALNLAMGKARNFDEAFLNLSAKGTVTAKLFDTLARQEGIDPLPRVDIETLEVGETFYVPGAKSLVRIVLKEGKKDLIQTPY